MKVGRKGWRFGRRILKMAVNSKLKDYTPETLLMIIDHDGGKFKVERLYI